MSPSSGHDLEEATRRFQHVLSASRLHLRRINLAVMLTIFASVAVTAVILSQGIGIRTVGDPLSVLFSLSLAVASARAVRYLIPEAVRTRLATRELPPAVGPS